MAFEEQKLNLPSPFLHSLNKKIFKSNVENTLGRAYGESLKDVDLSNWPRGDRRGGAQERRRRQR